MKFFSKLFSSREKAVSPTFDLTSEEKIEVNMMFNLLKDYVVHPSAADKLTQGLMARGLSNYAEDQIMKSEFLSQSAERENCINKAVTAIGKAYSIYQLPIYLYDLARYLELQNMGNESRKMYELFIARQTEYKNDQLDCLFLGERDIDEAKTYASQKLCGKILWQNIEPIEAIAEEIAVVSVGCGHNFVNNMMKDDNGIATSNSTSLLLATNEYLYFFLHYVSRLTFAFGGLAAQKKISNNIFRYAVSKLATILPEESRSDCFSLFQDGMNEAEREYSKCKRLTPEGGEDLKGTLFWEASKRISASAGGGMDIANLMCATEILTNALSSLKLEDKIKSLA